jgi:hypothetical protein
MLSPKDLRRTLAYLVAQDAFGKLFSGGAGSKQRILVKGVCLGISLHIPARFGFKDQAHLTLDGHQDVARAANGTYDPIP